MKYSTVEYSTIMKLKVASVGVDVDTTTVARARVDMVQ